MTDPVSPYLTFLLEATEQLDGVGDADKALKLALRTARAAFGADEACLMRLVPGKPRVEPLLSSPQGARWDAELLTRFAGERRPKMPERALIAPVRRWDRPWGVLALRRRAGDYDLDCVRDVARVGEVLSRQLERLDQQRVTEVRRRIDRKVLEQLRPNDLFYQILHGLRSLTRYDHSAAVLIQDADGGPLRVVAERIAWRKGKSPRVGTTQSLGREDMDALESGEVAGFDLEHGQWQPFCGRATQSLATALDYNHADPDGERREMCMLCAPLGVGEGLLGVLKIAALHPGTMRRYEAELVRRFLPQATVAIRNLQRTTSLESSVLAAERKHVVANLARGVSHDVNNALGAVLPLVQQMRVDVAEGCLDLTTLDRDLEQIEASLQVCRRIFGGMLGFAKSSSRAGLGEGDVRQAVESTLAVLEESLRRNAVDLSLELPERVPRVRGSQADLEQLFLNLLTNARDAMPDGGGLAVAVGLADGGLSIQIRDTGCGIPPEHQKRVREPFFTTKRSGTGLGLSICRSIVWNMKGSLDIASQVGQGTRVTVALPLVSDPTEEDA